MGFSLAWERRGTHKVGVGSLGELVLGCLADVRICRRRQLGWRARSTALKTHTRRKRPLQHLVDIHDCGGSVCEWQKGIWAKERRVQSGLFITRL